MAEQFNSSSSASLSSNSIGSTSPNAPMTSQQQLERLRNLIRVHLDQSTVNRPASQAIQPLGNLNDFMRVHLNQPDLNGPASQFIQPLASLNDLTRVQFGQPNLNETRASQVIHHDAANEHVSSQRWISNLASGHQQVTRSIQCHPRSASFPSEVIVTEVVRTTRFLIPPQTMRPRPFHLNVGFLSASTTMPRAFPLNGVSLNFSTTPTPTIRSFSPNPNTSTTPMVEPPSFTPNSNTSTLAPRPSTSNDYSHVNVSSEPRPLTPNLNLPISTSDRISAVPISSIPSSSETQGDGMTHSLPHSKYGPYTCPRCNSEFPTSQKFAAHMGSHYKHESKEETLRRRVTKYRNRPYYRNGVRVFLNADGSQTSSGAENIGGDETMSEASENVEPATNTPSEVTVKEEPTTDPPEEDNNKDEPTLLLKLKVGRTAQLSLIR